MFRLLFANEMRRPQWTHSFMIEPLMIIDFNNFFFEEIPSDSLDRVPLGRIWSMVTSVFELIHRQFFSSSGNHQWPIIFAENGFNGSSTLNSTKFLFFFRILLLLPFGCIKGLYKFKYQWFFVHNNQCHHPQRNCHRCYYHHFMTKCHSSTIFATLICSSSICIFFRFNGLRAT